MRLLLASDLHRNLDAARDLVRRSAGVDVVVIAGDLCSVRRGLGEIIGVLMTIETPSVVVPGNAESDEELRQACRAWPAAHALHGNGCEIGGAAFFGLGGGVPVTPFGDWSFDLAERNAAGLLAACPEGAVLVTHSPPKGHCDADSGGPSLGSSAILECIERTHPRLVVCGHIHAAWGQRSTLGPTTIINAGPKGFEIDLDAM